MDSPGPVTDSKRERWLKIKMAFLTLIGIISFGFGIDILGSIIIQIDNRIPIIRFLPDLGALFGLTVMIAIVPIRWVIVRYPLRRVGTLIGVFVLGWLFIPIVATKPIVEGMFADAGYHRCREHPEMEERGHRTMSLYPPQVWVLDPDDCTVP